MQSIYKKNNIFYSGSVIPRPMTVVECPRRAK